MEKQKLLVLGLTTILLAAVICLSGCVGEKPQPSQATTTQPQQETLETCAQLNGRICDVGDDCTGEWLKASDSFTCCSKECESPAEGTEKEVIKPFETTPENKDLGELV